MMLVATLCIVAAPIMTSAQTSGDPFGLNEAQINGLSTQTDVKQTIKNILGLIFGFLGLIAVLIVLYGGFIWMTAMGDEGKVDKAKKLIIAGIVGIVIILSAYSIAAYVIGETRNVLNS